MRFRFSLLDTLLFVALVAGGFGAFKGLAVERAPWQPWLFCALYLSVLAIVTALATCSRPPTRIAFLGSAIFGWVYLILVLRIDSELAGKENNSYERLDYACKVGLAFLALSALATYLSFRLFGKGACSAVVAPVPTKQTSTLPLIAAILGGLAFLALVAWELKSLSAVQVRVDATQNGVSPLVTNVMLRKGDSFRCEPYPGDGWTGGGTKRRVYCDYMGYPDSNVNWMRLHYQVGDEPPVPIEATKSYRAESDGMLKLFCEDGDIRDNQGSIGVSIKKLQ